MAKKLTAAILAAMSAALLILGGLYVKKSGYFEPYPDAEYLTAEAAAERPLYSQLSRKEQAVYTALYRGICEKSTVIPLPFDVDGEMYSRLYCMLEKQEGELFYIGSTYYTAQKIKNATIVLREDSADAIAEKENELAAAAEKIISRIPQNGDFEKALYIHDYLVSNCKYERKSENGYISTVYGCLVEGTANCEGYAKSFSYLARLAGLNAVLVTGTTDNGENHAWNKVKIGGDWYNLDVTWDDIDEPRDKRHIYFLCNDEDFSETHFDSGEYGGEFRCTNDAESYYKKLDLYISDINDADRIMRREISLGTETVEIKLADDEIYNEFKKTFFEEERIFEILSEYSSPILGKDITVNTRENEKENCMVIWFN